MCNGLFISIEGTDGSGKSTQIKLINEYLVQQGYEVVLTREPGGTKISEKVREILLDVDNSEMNGITEMLLYASARAQLVSEVILPAITSGKIVICDRYVDSSYVYQGIGRGIDFKIIESVNAAAVNGIMPVITLFFDIDPKTSLERRIASTGADRIEIEELDFHMRVYKGYLMLAQAYPERIKRIDSRKTIEEVFEEVKKVLNNILL